MKTIPALLFGALAVLVLGLSAFKVDVVRADCNHPSIPDWVSWSGSYPSWISSTESEPDTYTFSTTQGFYWCYTNAPTNGGVEIVPHANDNVSGVAYSPEYFFPYTVGNEYVLEIQISGTHDDEEATAYVETKGWCWPPYKSINRTVSIFAH